MSHTTNETTDGDANGIANGFTAEHPDSTTDDTASSSNASTTQSLSDSQSESSGCSVPQDSTWMDPQNRKMRVLTIGAGISGILMAYQIQKQCENVEHVIYDKNSDIGGTVASRLNYDIILTYSRYLAFKPVS